MSKVPFSSLVQPLRDVLAQLDAAQSLARQVETGSRFWRALATLETLPECVTFEPLGAAGALASAAEMPRRELPAAREAPRGGRSGALLLERRERGAPAGKGSSGVRSTSRAASALASAGTAPVPQREPALVAAAASGATREAGRAPSPQQTRQLRSQLPGRAPGALTAATEQTAAHSLADIARSASGPSRPLLLAARGRASASASAAGARLAPREPALPERPAPTREGAAPNAPAAPPIVARAAAPSANAQLSSHVEALWKTSVSAASARSVEPTRALGGNGAEAPAARAAGAAPASDAPRPRAASLLLAPRATTPHTPGAASAAAAPRAESPARLDAAGEAAGASHDDLTGSAEVLLERLNQALVEQAWLRGVDLT